MSFEQNPFEDPAWLRTMLWLLVAQLGGSIDVDLTPALGVLDAGPDSDLGQLAARYDSSTRVCLMTKDALDASLNVGQLSLPIDSKLN